jgi:hypothetical protein
MRSMAELSMMAIVSIMAPPTQRAFMRPISAFGLRA